MTTEPPVARGRPVRDGAILAAVIVVVMALWCGRSAFGGWWLADRTHSVDTYMISTIYERCAAQMASGHLPLWFPDFAGGYPVHSSWMYGMLYPPLLLFAVLPAEMAWTWLAILHVAFGAVGMFAFLWDERRDTAAAAAGAIVFALSGFALGRILCGHANIMMPFMWTPWVLRAALRTVRGVPGAWAWLGISSGLGMLSGHVQVWFYAAPLVTAACVFEMKKLGAWRAWPKLAGGAAIALGITAAQWLAAEEMFRVSGHPPEPKDLMILCSASWQGIVAAIAPGFLHPRIDFSHEYLGLAGPLAVAGSLLALRLRDSRRWFWFGVLAFGLLLSGGTRNAVSELANELPPFRFARAPGRAMTLVVIAGSVLSANLVADWFGAMSGKLRALVPVAFLASAALFGVRSPGSVPEDFQTFDWMQVVPPEARGHRVHFTDMRYPYPERRGAETIRDVCPLDTPGYKAMTWPIEGLPRMPAPVVAGWFDVGAEIRVPWEKGRPPESAADVEAMVKETKVRQFRVEGRGWFFPAANVAGDDETHRRMSAGERALFVASEDGAGLPVEQANAIATVRVLPSASPQEIVVDVQAPGWGGWVLISSKWYPGWTRVDDTSETGRVRRANLALMAVAVGGGHSVVRLRYEPPWLTAALVLGAAGWIAAAAGLVVTRRRVRDSQASR